MGRRRRNSRNISSVSRKNREKVASENSNSDKRESDKSMRQEHVTVSEGTIDVYSRLKLPLVQPTQHRRMSNDTDDEEDIVQLNFRPRFVFVSNLCLICMKQSEKICESCGMVSYCDNQHRELDWTKHRDLCAVLGDVCASGRDSSLLSQLSANEYRVYRLKLIEIVAFRLGRPLEFWEREILLYPRVCCICRCSSQTLRCCGECGIELFCEDHSDRDSHHEKWCREFRVFGKILFMQHTDGHVEPDMPNPPPRKSPLRLPNDLDSLMAQLYNRSAYYRDMDCHTYCSLSHIATIPLTTLYSVQVSCQGWEVADTLVIHVIGAEFQFECVKLHAWESFFLHLLPNLKHLRLIFVGPELTLPPVPLDLLAIVKTCSACKSLGRRISVSFHPEKFYHDFCRSEQFVQPHLVCLFNPGLYRETGFNGRDTWPETIKEFCKTGVPVCVTSYTKYEIPRDMIRIKSLVDVETILEPRRNPFASIKPDRNFVSDDTAPLIYKNYCIAIVRGKL
ncbi:hypothetical protein HN011_004534 [Eciton burchellii]|nr:hypothetical protein HN011_004534 [Eciton burchellii]